MNMTKGTVKVCLVLYSMSEAEQFQAISVPPKEAKRIVNQFKDTGKISFPSALQSKIVEVEPHSVVVSYVSDFYTKQD